MGRFLCAAGTVVHSEVPAAWWQPLPAAQQVLEVTHAITAATSAQTEGVAQAPETPAPSFSQDWQTGQCLPTAGTLLGHNGAEAFSTPYDHCTLIMPSVRRARAGQTIVRLARRRG